MLVAAEASGASVAAAEWAAADKRAAAVAADAAASHQPGQEAQLQAAACAAPAAGTAAATARAATAAAAASVPDGPGPRAAAVWSRPSGWVWVSSGGGGYIVMVLQVECGYHVGVEGGGSIEQHYKLNSTVAYSGRDPVYGKP